MSSYLPASFQQPTDGKIINYVRYQVTLKFLDDKQQLIHEHTTTKQPETIAIPQNALFIEIKDSRSMSRCTINRENPYAIYDYGTFIMLYNEKTREEVPHVPNNSK